jgi:hypothetical protein
VKGRKGERMIRSKIPLLGGARGGSLKLKELKELNADPDILLLII